LVALNWQCTHVGCTVPWNDAEAKFHCPCHGSVCLPSGQNVAGPAPRPLELMEIQVKGDQIFVSTGRITKRSVHDPSQAYKLA
jgi:cytochrome b6-f complex iron-sulfur subunit